MKPGGAYLNTFTAQIADGTLTDAASIPTATAYKNGTADATMPLTVTKISTGNYKVTGTIPSGYVSGDRLDVYVTGTIGTVSVGAWLPPDYIDSAFSSDVLSDTNAIHAHVQTLIEGVVLAATQSFYAPAKANDAMTLTAGERTTLAGRICDEALSGHSTAGTLGKALYDLAAGAVAMILTNAYDAAKNAAAPGAAMNLTSGYDAAKSAASAGALGVVSSKVDAVDGKVVAVDSAVGAVSAKVDGVQTDADSIVSSVSTLISNVAAVKAVVDATKTVVDAIKVVADAVRVVTDRLGGMIELDGAVYRFTLNALEEGPSGSGSSPEDVALAVLSAAVGTGGATVQEVLRAARAAAVGKLEKVDATTYRLYDDDGVTVVATFTVDSGGRTEVTGD